MNEAISPLTRRERAALACIAFVNQAIFQTCSVRIEGAYGPQLGRQNGRPIVYALWHGHQFPLFPLLKGQNIGVIVSLSRDGERVSHLMEEWGYRTFRGSSSRGAVAGLIGLIQHVKAGNDAAVTVDGPRGPRHKPKPGIFSVAGKTGAHLIPMAVECERCWRLRSWDRFIIPRPFSSYTARFGSPVMISDSMEENAARLKQALLTLAPRG